MVLSNLTDAQLVRTYSAGNETALEELITRHQSKIFGFIYSKVNDRDLADDLFQDTFIKVINTLKTGTYSEEGKFLPWVMRISHNLIVDHFRRTKKMPMNRDSEEYSVFGAMCDDSPTIETRLIQGQVCADLRQLIDTLPADQREVVEMRIYNDMSFKEISEITGVSINTALGRMRYALMNLRKMIDKHSISLSA